MLPFLLAYSVPLLTGPIPLVCATVGLEAAGGLALAGVAAGREAAGRDAAGRAGVEDREGAEARVDAVAAGGFGGLGAAGAFASLAGTAGPCRCGLGLAGFAA
jgi:hypothetical protein